MYVNLASINNSVQRPSTEMLSIRFATILVQGKTDAVTIRPEMKEHDLEHSRHRCGMGTTSKESGAENATSNPTIFCGSSCRKKCRRPSRALRRFLP